MTVPRRFLRIAALASGIALVLAAAPPLVAAQEETPDQEMDQTDTAILYEVEQRLRRADFLSPTDWQDLVIRVEDRVVYLGGSVDEPYEKQELVEIVTSIEEVRDVVIEPTLVIPEGN